MSALSSLSLFLFQDPVTPTGADIHIISICMIVIALFFFLVMVGAGIAVYQATKAVKKVEAKIDSLEKRGEAIVAQVTAKAMPIIDKAHEIINDLQPKIKDITDDLQPKIKEVSAKITEISGHVTEISANVVAMSNTVKGKVEEVGQTVTKVNGTVQDVNGKTQEQVQRVNGIVTDALTATQNFSHTVQHGIRVPITKAASWIAAAKLQFEHLAEKTPFGKKTKKPGSPYDL